MAKKLPRKKNAASVPPAQDREPWRALIDEENNYRQTVEALVAFSAFVTHDGKASRPGAEFGFGRSMTTSKANTVSPNIQLTPDLVAQKSGSFGIVAEVKRSLPKDREQWQKTSRQLRSYDDSLTGWWTPNERIANSNVVLLIHQSRGRAFAEHLSKAATESPEAVGENTSVVEFSHVTESVPYVFLRREYGSIQDPEFASRLHEGVQIPLRKLVGTFSNLQYYDAPPPILVLLVNLWSEVFPSLAATAGYDEAKGVRQIKVTVKSIAEELQQAHGSGALRKDRRSRVFPQQAWVRAALDRLVEFEMATKQGRDTYIVQFKRIQRDLRSYFAQRELSKGSKVENVRARLKQGTLFDQIGDQ